jgi:hypothetical protein
MTIPPFSSTIIALALIPVAFFFFHAYLTGLGKKRLHPVSGSIAIIWLSPSQLATRCTAASAAQSKAQQSS